MVVRNLERADFPSTPRAIDYDAFTGFRSLANVNLLEGLRGNGAMALWNYCFEQITIPSSVMKIGDGAFAEGHNLSEANLAG